jgi:hypothetical protein
LLPFENYKSSANYSATFFCGTRCVLMLTKYGSGYILGDFLHILIRTPRRRRRGAAKFKAGLVLGAINVILACSLACILLSVEAASDDFWLASQNFSTHYDKTGKKRCLLLLSAGILAKNLCFVSRRVYIGSENLIKN